MRIIGIMSWKGGCGKTSTTVNLAVALAEHLGKVVLVVDLDHTRRTSLILGGPDHGWNQSVGAALMGQTPITSLICRTAFPNVDLVPSHPNMAIFNSMYLKKSVKVRRVLTWTWVSDAAKPAEGGAGPATTDGEALEDGSPADQTAPSDGQAAIAATESRAPVSEKPAPASDAPAATSEQQGNGEAAKGGKPKMVKDEHGYHPDEPGEWVPEVSLYPFALRQELARLPTQKYDYVLLDTPGGAQIGTTQTITAATEALVPFRGHSQMDADEALETLKNLVWTTKNRLHGRLHVLGALPVAVKHQGMPPAVVDGLLTYLREKQLALYTAIPDTSWLGTITDAPKLRDRTVVTFRPRSGASLKFKMVAEEIEYGIAEARRRRALAEAEKLSGDDADLDGEAATVESGVTETAQETEGVA